MVETRGTCLCGDISFHISGEPVRQAQCHCRDCQQASGTGHMSLAFFRDGDVTITGETARYSNQTDSGTTMVRHFCPVCGSRLFSTNSAREGIISVAVGALGDSSWFSPQGIVYSSRRPAWDKMDDTLPAFEKMPPKQAK